MNKQVALLTFVTVILAACAQTPQKQSTTPAPVVELPSGPGNKKIQEVSPQEEQAVSVPPITNSTESKSGGYLTGDGPGSKPPVNLDDTPDAVPKVEPLHRYANRPYIALGKTYTPLEAPGNYKEQGIASWYGKKFHGLRTSSGEVYDMYGMTAAHPTLPIPSYARITNVATKKSIIVRVNDRGPFLHDRIIDLSYTAAHKLGIINSGSAQVLVESITADSSEPLILSTVVAAQTKSVPLTTEPTPPIDVVPDTPISTSTVATSTNFKDISNTVVGNVFLQLGAFKSPQGAESFLAKMQSELSTVDKSLSLFQKDGLQRVHLGPYKSTDEARAAAEKLKIQLGFKPIVSPR